MDQTGDEIANEVLLIRAKYKGPILLLEGSKDERFFYRFVKNSEMPIIPAGGKEKVLNAVAILETYNGVQGFMGIVDADFGHIDGSLPESQNVIVTDYHDVEMMIIKTKAFDAVLLELGSEKKIREFRNQEGEIRDDLIQKTLIIGHLRYLSMTDNLHLRFEGLHFDRFIDRNSLEIDQDKMLSNIFALTSNRCLDKKDVSNRLSELVDEMNDDPYQICCGHDFIEIFGIALRKILGSRSSKTAGPEVLGIALRLAYDSKDFHQTKLYADARMWSKRNKGYDIFGPLAS